MKLKQLGSNMTEIRTDKCILFSYETPVAGWDDEGAFKTDEYFSKTTSKHINKYFEGVSADKIRTVPQGHIDDIMFENVEGGI
jgi:hypothetical protein